MTTVNYWLIRSDRARLDRNKDLTLRMKGEKNLILDRLRGASS